MDRTSRYQEALRQIPSPGCGCHVALLSVANRGVIAGIEPTRLFNDIRNYIPEGSRKIRDGEIWDAIHRACADHKKGQGTFIPKPKPAPVVLDGKQRRQWIIEQSEIKDEADLWETSPIRLCDVPEKDPALFLDTLFNNTDLIWIGEFDEAGKPGKNIKPVAEWVERFRNSRQTAPHIILNPLTGKPAPKKSNPDEMTYRGDHCITAFKYCLIEFDNLTWEEQIRFWSEIKLPLVALIDTGGKSIHAWIDVQKLAPVSTSQDWEMHIKNRLYDRLLAPLGVDGACANPARLSRLPGHFREEKGKYQRLLWLSPEGRPVCQ